jgi:hypothetical protein
MGYLCGIRVACLWIFRFHFLPFFFSILFFTFLIIHNGG